MENPLISFVVIDSRSDKHPYWVNDCIKSIESQSIPIELLVVNNIGRKKTIGECWNLAVKQAKCDWVCFIGDDDFVSFDYAKVLWDWINDSEKRGGNVVNIATYMTAFEDKTGKKTALARQSTGAWKKEYLLEYPFNEALESGVDREYIEESIKRQKLTTIIEYYFGYFYRKHEDYSCAGEISFIEKPADYLFVTSNRIFLSPITERLAKEIGRENIIITPHVNPELLEKAKVIWVEWANDKAVEIANYKTDAKKILRLHAYEAFSDVIKKLDLNKFDIVIFIDEYIKDYIERQYGKVKGAVVIPNGVDLDKFTFNKHPKNNKIAYAGYLTRKKGIGELLLIAKSLPEYEFHLAGRFQEDDIADWFCYKKPDNVFIHAWQYDINEWYKDKTYILNTSMRESQAMSIMEGMACGLKPLVNDWIGASEIYGEYVYKNIEDLKRLLVSYKPEVYRDFVQNYDLNDIYDKIFETCFNAIEV